jgi:hypothetical protein
MLKPQRKNFREEYAGLLEHLDKWGSFVLANLIWCILAVLVIPLPAATAGLFSVMSLRVRGKQPELFQEFFGAMRRLWLKAYAIALIDLLVGGLVVLNLYILPMMDMSNPLAFLARSMTIFVGVALLLFNMYAWSLMVVVEDMTLKQIILASFKLVFAYPFWSIGVLIAAIVPLIISLLLPQIVLVLVTFSVMAFIIAWGTWRIIRRHLPEEDLEVLEAAHRLH